MICPNLFQFSDQMSQWSQVSRIALYMVKVNVTQLVSESVSQSVTRSPIELLWTAKNMPKMRELTKVQHTQTSNGYLLGLLFSVSGTMKWGDF